MRASSSSSWFWGWEPDYESSWLWSSWWWKPSAKSSRRPVPRPWYASFDFWFQVYLAGAVALYSAALLDNDYQGWTTLDAPGWLALVFVSIVWNLGHTWWEHDVVLVYLWKPPLAVALLCQGALVNLMHPYGPEHHPTGWLGITLWHAWGSYLLMSSIVPKRVAHGFLALVFVGFVVHLSPVVWNLLGPCGGTDGLTPTSWSSCGDLVNATNPAIWDSLWNRVQGRALVLHQSVFVPGSPTNGGQDDDDDAPWIAVDVWVPPAYHRAALQQQQQQQPPVPATILSNSDALFNTTTTTTLPILPTVLHMTRYRRRMQLTWPFSWLLWFLNQGTLPMIGLELLQSWAGHDVVFVSMDIRGSGASGGFRVIDGLDAEVDDALAVIQWIHQQPWCFDGACDISPAGNSYEGMMALGVAERRQQNQNYNRPFVSSVAALYTQQDVYQELVWPGGIHCKIFLEFYYAITYSMERGIGRQPIVAGHTATLVDRFLLNVIDGGPAVPTHWANGTQLTPVQRALVLRDHLDAHDAGNGNISATASRLEFRDSFLGNTTVPIKNLGGTKERLRTVLLNRIPLFVAVGTFDSGAVRAALYLLQVYQSLLSSSQDLAPLHMVVGPWTHGHRRAVTTHFAKPCYPLMDHARQFLQSTWRTTRNSKNDDNVAAAMLLDNNDNQSLVNDQAPLAPLSISVFELGSETWHHYTDLASFWQGPSTQLRHWTVSDWNAMEDAMGAANSSNPLGTLAPSSRAPYDQSLRNGEKPRIVTVSNQTTTGRWNRWNLMQQIFMRPVKYQDMAPQRTCFVTAVHADPWTTVVGTPLVTVTLSVPANNHQDRDDEAPQEVYVFATLEELIPEYTSPEENSNNEHDEDKDDTTEMKKQQTPTSYRARYITEGRYRVGFEPLIDPSGSARTFEQATLSRPFATRTSKEQAPPVTFTVPLEPLQYRLSQPGSRLRVCLAGHDRDNFDTPRAFPVWNLYSPMGLTVRTMTHTPPPAPVETPRLSVEDDHAIQDE